MKNKARKLSAILMLAAAALPAQSFFRTKERPDKLEDFDEQRFSWGFFLAANNFDYRLVLDPKYGMSAPNQNTPQQNLVQSSPTFSFGAGLMARARLSDNFDLRLEPGLQFAERHLTFSTQGNDRFAATDGFTPIVLTDSDINKVVKSTYVDIPLLLEFHGMRWYNSQPYIAAGFNWMVNLQSNQKSPDDNEAGVFRTTTSNFAWSAEMGIHFYFSRFKLTPAVRGTFMFNNELVKDNAGTPPYWAGAISQMNTRAFFFVLKFE